MCNIQMTKQVLLLQLKVGPKEWEHITAWIVQNYKKITQKQLPKRACAEHSQSCMCFEHDRDVSSIYRPYTQGLCALPVQSERQRTKTKQNRPRHITINPWLVRWVTARISSWASWWGIFRGVLLLQASGTREVGFCVNLSLMRWCRRCW